MSDLDRIDRNILRELSANARITNLALAERVGLSPSACLRRVQELERIGVIKGYRAILDRAALGVTFTAYVAVGLSRHTKSEQEDFERAIETAPEVRECDDKADGAVAAHAQVAGVVEKNHACCIGRILRCAQQGAYQHLIAAWLEHGGGAPGIVLAAQKRSALGHAALTQVRKTGDHQAGGFTTGVRVNDLNSFHGFGCSLGSK